MLARFLPLVLAPALVTALHNVAAGGSCSPAADALDPSTGRFVSECDAMTYCSSNGTCTPRGCRKDIFPFGYGSDPLPPMCPNDQFCPDEEDACQPLVHVGGQCQLNRDDECAPPPNWRTLSSSLNSNGSICLNFVCQYANVSLGQPCILENSVYTGFSRSGQEFQFVVSRDNCQTPAGYCDGVQRLCVAKKDFGAACGGDKECQSYNCRSSGTCGADPADPRHIALWEYIVTGLGILILTASTSAFLFLLHRRQRNTTRRERQAYWTEQTRFRNSLFAMHASSGSAMGDSRPGTMYSLAGQESGSALAFRFKGDGEGRGGGTTPASEFGEGSVRRYSEESGRGLISRGGSGRASPAGEGWERPL